MTKKVEATAPARRAFTPRVTPLSERLAQVEAPLEFQAEAPSAVPPREPAPIVPRPVPPALVALSLPRPSPDAPRPPKRLLWLATLIACALPFGWMAFSGAQRASTEDMTEVPASTLNPADPTVLEAASLNEAAEPAGAGVAAPVPAPSEERRPRPRSTQTAAARPPASQAAPRDVVHPGSSGFHGFLVVVSEPPGARVLVNGSVVGSTPLALDRVAVGSRVVRVEADGYEPWSAAVRVVANEQTHVTAVLTR